MSRNIADMILNNTMSDNYIYGQVDRLKEMYLKNVVEYGLEEARADTFMWKTINETQMGAFLQSGRLGPMERSFIQTNSNYLMPGSMDDISKRIANTFNLGGKFGVDNLITDELMEEASYRSRAAYLATVGYGDLENVLGPIRKDFIEGTTFDRGTQLSARKAQESFVEEYNKHSAGRYEVRLSSTVAKADPYRSVEKSLMEFGKETVGPSTKAGSRSAKTFLGIVDAKQVARAVTRL